MLEVTKVCKQCNVEKPLGDFHKSKTSRLGVNPRCKVCRNVKKDKTQKLDKYTNTARLAEQRYAANNKAKRQAKNAVRQALKDGRLIKTDCEHCGSNVNIEGHHPDYSKPLYVIWLCIKCHNKEHKRLRESNSS